MGKGNKAQRIADRAVKKAGGRKIRVGPDRGKWSGRKAAKKMAADQKKAGK